jgi:hypothetical protein
MAQPSSGTPNTGTSNAGTRLRPYLWWLVAFVVLLAGYADLWRGGTTLAPMLLVLGYCVFVPLAILK